MIRCPSVTMHLNDFDKLDYFMHRDVSRTPFRVGAHVYVNNVSARRIAIE
jgi:hypothetical protein